MFFKDSHYATFVNSKQNIDDVNIRTEREGVRQKFMELDNALWPFIERKGWDLHRHRIPQHYVSSAHFVYLSNGQPVVQHIDSMWLHYGKSPKQLDFVKQIPGSGYDYKKYDDSEYFNAFYLHTRIQFYINAEKFRVWLLLATDKNYYDRSEFLKKIKIAHNMDQFFELIRPLLGKGFYYEINGERLVLDVNSTKQSIANFIKKDKHGVYSGIVKEYAPSDERINEVNIVVEMKANLELLYPLYLFMAWRPDTKHILNR